MGPRDALASEIGCQRVKEETHALCAQPASRTHTHMQGVFELVVHFETFRNVDLFRQG